MPLPPTLRQLLEDPIYRKMFRTPPRLSFVQTVAGARPWAVYLRMTTEDAEGDLVTRWRGARCIDYPTAFKFARDQLRAEDSDGDGGAVPTYSDIAVVSRAVLYPPPPGFDWRLQYAGGHLMGWCGRCRRPTNFRYRPKHHALKNAPARTRDDAKSCYYCGMRQAGMPAYRVTRLDP